MSIIFALIIAVVIVVAVFIAIDYFAAAGGGNPRLWLLLKGLVVLAAVFYFLQRYGIV